MYPRLSSGLSAARADRFIDSERLLLVGCGCCNCLNHRHRADIRLAEFGDWFGQTSSEIRTAAVSVLRMPSDTTPVAQLKFNRRQQDGFIGTLQPEIEREPEFGYPPEIDQVALTHITGLQNKLLRVSCCAGAGSISAALLSSSGCLWTIRSGAFTPAAPILPAPSLAALDARHKRDSTLIGGAFGCAFGFCLA